APRRPGSVVRVKTTCRRLRVNEPASDSATANLRESVVLAVRGVHLSVRHLLRGRRANVQHCAIEAQSLSGQWMIAVDDHLAVGDIGHREHLPCVIATIRSLARTR